MNQKLCLLICFFVGVLVYYLLKNTCGCKVVEGNCVMKSGVDHCAILLHPDNPSAASTVQNCFEMNVNTCSIPKQPGGGLNPCCEWVEPTGCCPG